MKGPAHRGFCAAGMNSYLGKLGNEGRSKELRWEVSPGFSLKRYLGIIGRLLYPATINYTGSGVHSERTNSFDTALTFWDWLFLSLMGWSHDFPFRFPLRPARAHRVSPLAPACSACSNQNISPRLFGALAFVFDGRCAGVPVNEN